LTHIHSGIICDLWSALWQPITDYVTSTGSVDVLVQFVRCVYVCKFNFSTFRYKYQFNYSGAYVLREEIINRHTWLTAGPLFVSFDKISAIISTQMGVQSQSLTAPVVSPIVRIKYKG